MLSNITLHTYLKSECQPFTHPYTENFFYPTNTSWKQVNYILVLNWKKARTTDQWTSLVSDSVIDRWLRMDGLNGALKSLHVKNICHLYRDVSSYRWRCRNFYLWSVLMATYREGSLVWSFYCYTEHWFFKFYLKYH